MVRVKILGTAHLHKSPDPEDTRQCWGSDSGHPLHSNCYTWRDAVQILDNPFIPTVAHGGIQFIFQLELGAPHKHTHTISLSFPFYLLYNI